MLQIRIHFLSGARQGTVEVYPTARYNSLYCGRDPGCDVRFDADLDATVSRSHAVIEWRRVEGGPWKVQISDLLSSNGTFVNDREVRETTPLRHGDRIRFGRGGPEVRIDLNSPSDGEHAPPLAKQTLETPRAVINETLQRRQPK